LSSSAQHRLNLSAGLASVAVALSLVALKLWALVSTGALSIAASLTDSALDLLASSAGLLGILYAAKPPDAEHSFGHSAVEDLVALGQAVLVAGSALLIGWRAVSRLSEPEPLSDEGTGIAVMAVSIALTLALVLWQRRVARATGSRIVAADQLHYLGDLLPNIGAIAALAASAFWGVGWLDPVVALAACAMLLIGARSIGLRSWHALMDRSADAGTVARIERILRNEPAIAGFHDLRTRTSGTRIFIQVHLELDGNQSLNQAHAVGARLRRAIIAELPQADVIIHKDPV
jgi:ferrous-iron efflux pump FieF